MFLLIFAVWLILNGRVTLETVLFGLVISALLFAFSCLFLRHSVKRDIELMRKSLGLIKLIFVLFAEIVKSNLAVLPYIYHKDKKPEPIVARFTVERPRTDTGKVLLANCITMTPGTITGSLKGSEYLVHCLDKSMAEGLADSVFTDVISEWEDM